ncbi:MAG TPA: hypothetical protein DIT80_11450 [Lachnospiraceae bacterium]|nr:hypothetical protein [Lachnospiraceae bacterium]
MGMFVNPDNSAFQAALNAQIYVDKSGLLVYTNRVLASTDAFICNSRPRRFGKSITANMLAAYYSKGCDSSKMFEKLKISQSDGFKKHLNKYDVIQLDIQWCINAAGGADQVVSYITEKTISELQSIYPEVLTTKNQQTSLPETLAKINVATGNKFVVIIVPLINRNYDGLKNAIIEMLSGAAVKVNTATFKNDMLAIKNRDDVLTYMIHLGYLGYDQTKKMAFIPNEEIRQELTIAVESRRWDELLMFQQESEQLLTATLNMDGEAVASQIEKIHNNYVSVIQYNNENSLSSVLAIAYLCAMQYYFKPIRELPTGRGFADFVFIPKPEYQNEYPALIVELKWNRNAQTAMQQIKDRNYPASILSYTGDILLVAINYDKSSKEHQCQIEQYQKE